VYLGGIIAYANEVKTQTLGVRDEDLRQHGAVSEPVAAQLAAGICARLGSEIGIGVTGIAGPGGGSAEKPVGTVWIAMQLNGAVTTLGRVYVGDRDEIRRRSCQAALDMIRRALAARV
jgi:PncC family amidohydrolase